MTVVKPEVGQIRNGLIRFGCIGINEVGANFILAEECDEIINVMSALQTVEAVHFKGQLAEAELDQGLAARSRSGRSVQIIDACFRFCSVLVNQRLSHFGGFADFLQQEIELLIHV